MTNESKMENPFMKKEGNIFREDHGMVFEQFEVDMIFEHRPGRTITSTDNTWFTLLTCNQHPIHFDENYAQKSRFGKTLVNSTLTLAIVTGMTVNILSYKCIANLGWDNVRLTHPVFVGDTLYAASRVVSVRESNSRKGQGIIKVETVGHNQNGKVVISFERNILIPKKNFVIEDKVDVDLNQLWNKNK